MSNLRDIVLIYNKPKLMYKILKNYVNMLIFKKEVLRTVSISISKKCNFGCKHCSFSDLSKKNKKLMDSREIIRIIDQSIDLGAIQINLTGGDPFYNKDIYKFISHIHKKGCLSTINTNGFYVKENILKLKRVGLNIIMTSLDSPDKESHDNFRKKKGAFEKTIIGIKEARKEGINVVVCTVATNENIKNKMLEKNVKLILKLDATPFINYPVSIGRWKNKKVKLTMENMKKVRKIINKYPVRTCMDHNYFNKGCKAGIENLYITYYGDVFPCDFIQKSFGNISNEKLIKIWNRIPKKKNRFRVCYNH